MATKEVSCPVQDNNIDLAGRPLVFLATTEGADGNYYLLNGCKFAQGAGDNYICTATGKPCWITEDFPWGSADIIKFKEFSLGKEEISEDERKLARAIAQPFEEGCIVAGHPRTDFIHISFIQEKYYWAKLSMREWASGSPGGIANLGELKHALLEPAKEQIIKEYGDIDIAAGEKRQPLKEWLANKESIMKLVDLSFPNAKEVFMNSSEGAEWEYLNTALGILKSQGIPKPAIIVPATFGYWQDKLFGDFLNIGFYKNMFAFSGNINVKPVFLLTKEIGEEINKNPYWRSDRVPMVF